MSYQSSVSRRSLIRGALTLAVGLGLSACTNGGPTSSGTDSNAAGGGSGPQPQSDAGGSAATTPEASGSHKVLVACFSAQGHTKRVARRVAQDLGADMFDVVPAQPYGDDDLNFNNDQSRVVREYQDPSQRDIPLSVTTPENWTGYDVIFVGYPIWWQDHAWPIAHFVSDNDFTGKTVIPFCTSMSSGIGGSARSLAAVTGGGSWQDGHRFGENASDGEVDGWVDGLSL